MSITITINTNAEARHIIHEATTSMMQAVNFNPDNHETLYDFMVEECAFILSERFIDGTYTPMQYNAIRNNLARILWNIFKDFIEEERYYNSDEP